MHETSSSDPALRSMAEVATPQARRYLAQRCKHFGHKMPTTCDAQLGHIAFPTGDCHLRADSGMQTLNLAATGKAGLEQLRDVIARHLVRFPFREDLDVAWRAA
jgi:uncharacterized protein